jgi:hypothetical protein
MQNIKVTTKGNTLVIEIDADRPGPEQVGQDALVATGATRGQHRGPRYFPRHQRVLK